MLDKTNLWAVDINPLLDIIAQGHWPFDRAFGAILALTIFQIFLIIVVAQSMLILICATKAGERRLENDPDLAWVSTFGHWVYLPEAEDAPEKSGCPEKLPHYHITEAAITEGPDPRREKPRAFCVYEGIIRLALASALIMNYSCYVPTSTTEATIAARVATVSLALLALLPLATPWWVLKNHRLACTLGYILWMNFNILFLFQFVTARLERLLLWTDFVVYGLVLLYAIMAMVMLPICIIFFRGVKPGREPPWFKFVIYKFIPFSAFAIIAVLPIYQIHEAMELKRARELVGSDKENIANEFIKPWWERVNELR